MSREELAGEIMMLQELIDQCDNKFPTCLSHNDLIPGNIIIDDTKG